MRKKMIWCDVVLVVALLVAGGTLVWPHLWTVTTHHAKIWIRTDAYETEKGRMLKDYEQVVQAVEAWAGPAGFYRLPDDTNLPRQRWFGSGTERNERIVWFQEKNPRDKSFPKEVMIASDPDGPFDIELLLAEGYSRHPSRKLQDMFEALRQRAEELHLGQVHGSIW